MGKICNNEEIEKKLDRLIQILCDENINFNLVELNLSSKNYDEKLKIFHSLCLLRNQNPLSCEFLKLQNDIICYENSKKNVVDVEEFDYSKNMAIFVGDISFLKADAIVCGGKDSLTKRTPESESLSNKILLSGGLQIVQELLFILSRQENFDSRGFAKLVKAYNLPSKYIIYTVGPRIRYGKIGYQEKEDLVNCYKACLELALSKNFKTVVFSSISTGGKNYPKKLAAEIAVCTVSFWLKANDYPFKVVFCVFDEENKKYYEASFNDYEIR